MDADRNIHAERRHTPPRVPARGFGTVSAARTLITAVSCGVMLACSAAPRSPEPGTRMSQDPLPASPTARSIDTTYPVVRVALGDSLRALRNQSTLPMPDDMGSSGDNINVTTPVQLTYGSRQRPLVFPPGLFLSLVPMAGHVVEIRVSPHLYPLTLDDAIALAGRVDASAAAAGWSRAQVLASTDSVRHAVAGLSPVATYKQALSRWRADNGDEMYVSVQRVKSAEDVRSANAAYGKNTPEHDQFLIDVYLTNGPVFDRYAAADRAR